MKGKIVVSSEEIDKAVEVKDENAIFHLAQPYPPFKQVMPQLWAPILDKE